jgi:hypothetical protein
MVFKERVTQMVVQWVVELPARRQGFDKLVQNLRDSGEALQRDLERLQDNETNQHHLRHIVAIEKWGQRRLRVALGEPFVKDENHDYQPSKETTWPVLKDTFIATRAETLSLAGLLEQRDSKQTVPHNQFGPLSVLAWLRYLETHARLEGKRLR